MKQVLYAAVMLLWVLHAPAAASPLSRYTHATTFPQDDAMVRDTILHFFGGGTDGINPASGLITDKAGALYGTTTSGGGGNGCESCGMVFKLTPSKKSYVESPLYRFVGPPNDGYQPFAGLTVDGKGALFGTTRSGGNGKGAQCGNIGCGIVFELIPVGSGHFTEHILYNFKGNADGASPQGEVILDGKGNLYGTTIFGGKGCGSQGCGTVYELGLGPGGYTEKVLFKFPGYSVSGGAHPYGSLVIDKAGKLYGTTSQGGSEGCHCGTIFQLVPAKPMYTENVLYSFFDSPDGSAPMAGLIADRSGTLYGTTKDGGAQNFGTVFNLKQTSSGTYFENVLYSFQGPGRDGALPQAPVIRDRLGKLYGTTSTGGRADKGTVFALTPPKSISGSYTETVLHAFTGPPSDGDTPLAGLLLANGKLYGTTFKGGVLASYPYGSVFSLSATSQLPFGGPGPSADSEGSDPFLRLPPHVVAPEATWSGWRSEGIPSCALASGLVCTQPFYDLGVVSPLEVKAINNVGDIVGAADNASGIPHSAILHEFAGLPMPRLANGVTDLGVLQGGPNEDMGYAISDLWDSSGDLDNAFGTPFAAGESDLRAFLWEDYSMASLSAPTSAGYGVDLEGDVTGQHVEASQNNAFAITWLNPPSRGEIVPKLGGNEISSGQGIVTLNSPPSAPLMFAGYQVSKQGDIGEGFLYNSATRKLSFIRPLRSDVGVVPRAMTSHLIVGDSYNKSAERHAFYAKIVNGKAGDAIALPTTAAQSYASAVAASGYIVGYTINSSHLMSAALWIPALRDGAYEPIDLNTFAPSGWSFSEGVGINDRNQIIGLGSKHGGQSHAFLLLMNRHVIDLSLAHLTVKSVNALAYLGYDLVVQDIWAQMYGQPHPAKGNLQAIATAGYQNAVYVLLRFDDSKNWPGDKQMKRALKGLEPYISPTQTAFVEIDVEKCYGIVPCWEGPHTEAQKAVRQAIISEAIEAWSTPPFSDIPVIIYTNKDSWDTLVGLSLPSKTFSDCALLDANPDNLSDVGFTRRGPGVVPFKPYGVWTARSAKQYETHNSSTIHGEDILGVEAFVGSIASPVTVDINSFDWDFFSTPTTCVTGSSQ